MHKYTIRDKDFQNMIYQWLQEDGEIWVEVYFPRMGGMSFASLVDSISQLQTVLDYFAAGNNGATGSIDVFRHPKFLLRGIVDDSFIAKALETFSDADEWMSAYPIPNHPIGCWQSSGDMGHKLLIEILNERRGKYVVMGLDSEWPNSVSGTPGYENQIMISASIPGKNNTTN